MIYSYVSTSNINLLQEEEEEKPLLVWRPEQIEGEAGLKNYILKDYYVGV